MQRTVLALAVLLTAAAFASPAAAGTGHAAATFTARGSVEQVQVTGARAGARLSLVDRRGRQVGSRRADSPGGLLFRNGRPGAGYPGRQGSGRSAPGTGLSVRSAPPGP